MNYVLIDTTFRAIKKRKFSSVITVIGVSIIVMTLAVAIFLMTSIVNLEIEIIKKNIAVGFLNYDIGSFVVKTLSEDLRSGGVILQLPMLIVLIVVIIAGMLLLFNTFNIAITQRIDQYSVFYLIGSTETQLKRASMYESLVFGLIGVPVGIFLGYECTRLIIRVFEEEIRNIFIYNTGLNIEFYTDVGYVFTIAVISFIMIASASMWTSANINRRVERKLNISLDKENQNLKKKNIIRRKLGISQRFGVEASIASNNYNLNRKNYRYAMISVAMSTMIFLSVSLGIAFLKANISHNIGIDISEYIAFRRNNLISEVDGVYEIIQIIIAIEVVSYGFVLAMMIVALANVCNTISGMLEKRRNEFNILSSIGMSPSQLKKMIFYECGLFGFNTLLNSVVTSGVVLIVISLFANGEEAYYEFPLINLIISFGLIFVLVLLTLLYAIKQLAIKWEIIN